MSRDLINHECGVKGNISITSYWGGAKHKQCIQVTTDLDGYSQMTYTEAIKFFHDVIKKIEEYKI